MSQIFELMRAAYDARHPGEQESLDDSAEADVELTERLADRYDAMGLDSSRLRAIAARQRAGLTRDRLGWSVIPGGKLT